MKFGIYNEKGLVIRVGSCPDAYVDLQAMEGEYVFKGEIDLFDKVIHETGERLEMNRSKPPGEYFVFDRDRERWVKSLLGVWEDIKAKRAALLAKTDWMVARAQDTGNPMPVEWTQYRQALRDITEQPDPFNITWPTAPQ